MIPESLLPKVEEKSENTKKKIYQPHLGYSARTLKQSLIYQVKHFSDFCHRLVIIILSNIFLCLSTIARPLGISTEVKVL